MPGKAVKMAYICSSSFFPCRAKNFSGSLSYLHPLPKQKLYALFLALSVSDGHNQSGMKIPTTGSSVIMEWATISTEPLGNQCPNGRMGLDGGILNTMPCGQGRNGHEVCEAPQ